MEYISKFLSLFSPKVQIKITSSILFCIMVFFLLHCFLIPLDLTKLDLNKMNTLVDSHALALIILLVMPILFAGDPLQFADQNKVNDARFFQEQFPSRYVMNKFSINKAEAETYWFGIFNKWADTDHPKHEMHKRTFEVGFTCRLIYFLKLWFLRFGVFSVIVLLVNVYLQRLQDYFLCQSMYIAIVWLAFVWIMTTHKPNTNNPTGVWSRWKQINDMHKVWIDNNASTLVKLKQLAQ